MVRFDGVHAFGNNSAENEPIWMKFGGLGVHCRALVLPDFERDPRSIARAGERGEFLFSLSGKHRTISPISVPPNFTKFTHNT